jgi:polyketide synthase PksJ
MSLLPVKNMSGDEIVRSYPCSDLQTQLFFAEKVSSGRGEYNAAVAWELSPSAEVDRLTKSLGWVTDRHEVLRTRFKLVAGRLNQFVGASSVGEYIHRDLSRNSRENLTTSISDELRLLCQASFDLEDGPTHRVAVIQLPQNRQIVCVVMHHIICDERSFEIFFQELTAAYAGPPRSPIYSPQFRDYCQSLDGGGGHLSAPESQFWETQLASHTPVTVRDVASRVGAEDAAAIQISGSQFISISDLTSLSAKLSCTPFIVGLAAFKILLRRYTGICDLCVATPVTLRTNAQWENAIGPFTHMVPVRTTIRETDSVAETIRRERDAFLEAVEHREDLPPDAHVRLGYDSFNRQILFQWSYSQPLPNVGPFTATKVETPFPGLKTDLGLKARVANGRMSLLLSFSTDRITRSTGEGMLRHLDTLLREMISNSAQCVRDVKIVVGEERRALLEEWSGASRLQKEPLSSTILDLFAWQSNRNGTGLAVACGEDRLSYRDLDDQSSKLGWYLRARGVRTGTLVALQMGRSVKMIVALLGVMKAGGAYLPLDPNCPHDRLRFMLEDAQAKLLLTDARVAARSPRDDIDLVCVDEEWQEIIEAKPNELETAIGPDDLAYVIYTSGSSGRPKGVMIEHGSLANYVVDMVGRLDLKPDDVVLAATNICFDISVTEIICPLVAGARIFLTRTFAEITPAYLANAILRGGVNVMQSTPTFYNQLLSQDELSWLKDVKVIVVGGEPVSDSLVEKLRATTNARLCNAYGPTETCVWSTMSEIEAGRAVTAGKPLANTAVYVLDPDLDCQPANIPGEIYIVGAGLARGYLNAADKTAKQFLRLDKIGVDRAYKTGDMGAWLSTGELVLLGRQDHQVKWKGCRIELEEIDAVVREHPRIVDAAAILTENANPELVLCYVASAFLPSEELAEFGRQQLPLPLVPTAFLELSEMPTNANGKTDRHALGEIFLRRQVRSTNVAGIAPPQTANEELLWLLWGQVLSAQGFGVDDNFFALGGQSMGLAQLQSLVSQAVATEVPFMELFSRPTIRQQADYLDTLTIMAEKHGD